MTSKKKVLVQGNFNTPYLEFHSDGSCAYGMTCKECSKPITSKDPHYFVDHNKGFHESCYVEWELSR